MSRSIKVSQQAVIASLAAKGWSIRRIAREMGLHRCTVRRFYCRDVEALLDGPFEAASGSKCTTPLPKVSAGTGPDLPGLAEALARSQTESKCTTSEIKVSAGSRSCCEGLREVILPLVEAGLSAKRIYQDLRTGHGFVGSYSSVKRFVAGVKVSEPRRVWRIECEPGEELQVDFLMGPMVPSGTEGKLRRTWVFRAVLSHSRKGYTEAALRQDTESFLRVLENALRAFGGVPLTLNLDNLRAAVKKADWFDPELAPKFAEFCRHYGTTAIPCRPYMPQHKGKVERSVQYVKDNALKGRSFGSLQALNQHLRQWEQSVADQRIHGTTCQQVGKAFEQRERPALQALPAELFPCYQEGKRRVNRDGYVEVAKAYYEAPAEHIGHDVWVRWDGRSVQLLDAKMELMATHVRQEPGRYSSGCRGLRGLEPGPVKRTAQNLLQRAAAIGSAAGQWAQQVWELRGAEGIRSLMGLCGLLKTHRSHEINQACATALAAQSNGAPSLRTIKQLVQTSGQAPQQQIMLPFAQSHPIIRELSTYSQFVEQQQEQRNQRQHQEQQDHEPHHDTQEPSTQTAA